MKFRPNHFYKAQSGFTMIEIALSLAVIGIALVAIIGVLPIGMNVQKDNREATIVDQDATVFIGAIRNGARGLNYLTNYVYAITNYWGKYSAGALGPSGANGYNYSSFSIATSYFSALGSPINSGTNIVELLSTPEYTDNNGVPIPYLVNGYSNHVVAYVRSISGAAVEKPPQDNSIIQQDSFSYEIICDNLPVAVDTNSLNFSSPNYSPYDQQLTANLHELRLTFLWPLLPDGNLGAGRQTFRTMVGGQVVQDANNNYLYYLQSQSFTNVPVP